MVIKMAIVFSKRDLNRLINELGDINKLPYLCSINSKFIFRIRNFDAKLLSLESYGVTNNHLKTFRHTPSIQFLQFFNKFTKDETFNSRLVRLKLLTEYKEYLYSTKKEI